VRIHSKDNPDDVVEATMLPKEIAGIFGVLLEKIASVSKEPNFFGADVLLVSDIAFSIKTPTEEEKQCLREYFGDKRPTIAVSMPVQQAVEQQFGKGVSAQEVGAFLGLPAVDLVRPYTGRHPDLAEFVIYKNDAHGKPQVYSTAAVEMITR
jgi:hypothetical protein